MKTPNKLQIKNTIKAGTEIRQNLHLTLEAIIQFSTLKKGP